VGPVSVPCAGVRLVRRALGDLSTARVVVIGAGRTGMAVCRFLTRRELGGLVVVNRTPVRARAVADRFGGTTAPWDELVGAVAEADAVLAATHAPSAVLTRALLEPVAAARRGRPLLLVDLSAPRNVDPAAGTLEGVTVRDLDHLGELVDDNLTARAAEVPLVEEIIDHEARRFTRWYERLRRPVAFQPSVEPVRETGAA
jgi:glutamyl-tRNA reductase